MPRRTSARRSRAGAVVRCLACVAASRTALGTCGWLSRTSSASSASSTFDDATASGEVLVAIGDVHGDPDAGFRALALAGVVDGRSWWRSDASGSKPESASAARATLVQTGDLVDRGDRSIEAVDEFERLKSEAAAVGDEVVTLLGNHELMTLQHDLRFVSRDELAALGKQSLDESRVADASDDSLGLGLRAYFYAGQLAWKKTFGAGQRRGVALREKPFAAVRGKGKCATVFAHAGLLPGHLFGKDTVDALNERGRELLRDDVVERGDDLLHNEGPVWTRVLSMGSEEEACQAAEEVIERLGVQRIVIGHTVTKSGSIETRCDGLIHMIDVGMSALYGGEPSAWMCTEAEGPVAISSDGRRTVLE